MYKAALIQNESEMVRHGWADIRPMLAGLDYEWVDFTSERLNELFADIEFRRYDAIVIATNACNDASVKAILQAPENRERLAVFLEGGGGIFLSLQMRLNTGEPSEILPDEYDVKMIKRPESEPGEEGHLVIDPDLRSNILLSYPYRVSNQDIVNQCMHNEFVKSLYRAFVAPVNDENFDMLLYDESYDTIRPLLLSSRVDLPGRVVVSAVPLDWQAHRALLQNVVRYIVEGQPHLAVIEKRGQVMADFQYLLANLESKKIPFSKYVQEKLSFAPLNLGLHKTIVIDPTWGFGDLQQSDFGAHSDRFKESGTRVLFFGLTHTNDPILSQVGGMRSSQGLLPSIVAWVRSRYADGRWEGSFWKTFDVISTFDALGISTAEYAEEVIASIRQHDINGSYDEVMGATCALARLYKIFLGANSQEFQRTVSWIKQKYPESGFYEQASAIEALNDVDQPLDTSAVEVFRSRVMDEMQLLNDELRIYRYARTLLSCDYVEDALRLARHLEDFQSVSGDWLNVSRTASILLLLIDLQTRLVRPSQSLDSMIFKGVVYLKSMQSPGRGNWNNDIPASVKALRAIIEFEERVSFPIDEIVINLDKARKLSYEIEAIETATRQNTRLQREKSGLSNRLQKEQENRKLSTRLSIILSIILLPTLALIISLLLYAWQSDRLQALGAFLTDYFTNFTLPRASILALIPLIILYWILRSLNAVPSLIDLERIEDFLVSRFRSDETEGDE